MKRPTRTTPPQPENAMASFCRIVLRPALIAWLLVAALAGCGSGGGSSVPPPPPAGAPVTQMISAATGGTINGPGGVTLQIPAGALSADTAITIALDGSGAPTAPGGFTGQVGPMVALTPHDLRFAAPVRLSLPVPASATADLVLLKTNEGRQGWRSLPVSIDAGRISTSITSFSNIAVFCCLVSNLAVEVFPKTFIWNEGGFALLRADAAWAGHQEREGVYATYQWLRNGLPLGGETLDTILIDPLRASDDGAQISVRVQLMRMNIAPFPPTPNLAPVTSTPVTLQVRAAAPVFVNQPLELAVTAGQPASFTAASTSSVPQTLRWRRCDDPTRAGICPADCLAAAWRDVTGATANTLTLGTTALGDDGARFALLAANSGGTACSRAAGLTVTPAPTPPAIIGMASPGPLFAGDSGSFTVNATGSNLAYRWETQPPGAAAFAPVQPAVNAATYTVSSVSAADNGTLVRVVVSNSLGSVTLDPPRLLEVRQGAALVATRVVAANDTSVVLAADGGLVAWGRGNAGQLGNGARQDSVVPARIAGANSIATFAGGIGVVLAIRADGTPLVWGSNSHGLLGDAGLADALTPQPIAGFGPGGARGPVVDLAADLLHAIAATADGRVWTWGRNPDGQLGDGTAGAQILPPPRAPAEVPGLSNIAKVSAGLYGSAALDRSGRLWVWGSYSGHLGARQAYLSPTPVPLPAPAVDVSLGSGDFALVLLADGRVLTWGENGLGQLGLGDTVNRYAPEHVALPDLAVGIAAGHAHALALLADGRVMAWGRNAEGQLGDGSLAARSTPVQVAAPLPPTIRAIAAGRRHSLAFDASGRVWAWGRNGEGQLGNGGTADSPLPVQVPNFVAN
jgi:alpha-tubulin suppressor-like RCC1 family protein